MDTNILGASVTVPCHQMVHQNLDDLKEFVLKEIAHKFAEEMIKSNSLILEERPGFDGMSKEFIGKIAVVSQEEYLRLQRIESSTFKAKQILNNF